MKVTKTAIGLALVLAIGVATVAFALPNDKGKHAAAEKRQAQRAKELAGKLDLPASRVQRAMAAVRSDHQKANRKRRAAVLGSKLGVSADSAEHALDAGMAARKGASGEKKERGKAFRAAVAKDLGKGETEVSKALKSTAKEVVTARLDQAVKSGMIPKKRAEKLRKRIDSGKVGPRVRRALR